MRTIRNSAPKQKEFAGTLRKTMTHGERILWAQLRNKGIGFRVRRQYPVDKYVLDFYIHEARLCIEIDGPEHDKEHDEKRDGILGDMGIRTIRIPWTDIPDNMDYWLNEIKAWATVRAESQPNRTKRDIAEHKRFR